MKKYGGVDFQLFLTFAKEITITIKFRKTCEAEALIDVLNDVPCHPLRILIVCLSLLNTLLSVVFFYKKNSKEKSNLRKKNRFLRLH